MKYIIIVPDGMADNPVEQLGNKTPLEVAKTPHMDYLAQEGLTGLVKTIPDGMHPGSDIGNMAIMGYDPTICHTGRAPLEAANQNIILDENQVAFRCNFVTIVDNKMVDYSAGHIKTEEAALLIDTLNQSINIENVKFHTGKSYRHLLMITPHDPKSFLKIKTTAPHDILGKNISSYLPHGAEAKFLLNLMERSKEILEHHPINDVRIDLKENPANMIWLWGQGSRPMLTTFEKKFGMKGAIISAVDLVCGIGKLIGLEIIDVPGITGYYDTNYLGKAEYALRSLEKNDFVYIHIEAPDEAGHSGDIKAKITAIERIDKDIVGTILKFFDQQHPFRILLLPDHPTPVELRTHTADPVGFVMYGTGIEKDGSNLFNERTAKEKGMRFESGESLVNFFIIH